MRKNTRRQKKQTSFPKISQKLSLFKLYPILLIITVGFIIYSNSFNNSFQFDDEPNIVFNTSIHDIGNIKNIWDLNNLRFVGYYSFALNYHFNKDNVFGYHFINVIIHIAASCFAYWLVLLIFSAPVIQREEISKHKNLLALFCGLIFVSHPLQTQAVSYIVQRFASLATLFYLASLSFYLKARLSRKRDLSVIYFSASAIAALLGMLTKETVFTLPFAILLFEFGFVRKGTLKEIVKSRTFLIILVPILIFTLIIPLMLLLKYGTDQFFATTASDRLLDQPLTSTVYLMTQFRVIVAYLRLLAVPLGQNLDHDIPASRSLFELPTIASFLFLAVLVVIALWLYPRKKLMAVGIIWFFLTLGVESSIQPLRNVMFEHRVYLPMFGFCLFFASFIYHLLWGRHPKALIIVLITAVCCYSFLTYQRNKVWKNAISLWSDATQKSPDKTRPHYNLGKYYMNRGIFNKAINEFQLVLSINPEDNWAYTNLGSIYLLQRKLDEAVQQFKKALSIRPDYDIAHYNLGSTLIQQGKIEEAIQEFSKAVSINPQYEDAYYNWAIALVQLERIEEALEKFNRVLRINPNSYDVHYNLGVALMKQGKKKKQQSISNLL
ncbi:tetratricopeptide repeat protein [Candidatus Latescibacterota bacterium]